ncbi:unnamed protein product [Lactuca virosa]|uniref:Uncharacterized protein n=1 Tax=Lactuca virosa TaxID=75947 RepID=A0AAU9M4V7_9ASTR|nr:unnamed protein product [Lactuca virosa]
MIFGNTPTIVNEPTIKFIKLQLHKYLSKIEGYCVPGDEIDELVLAAGGKSIVWDRHNRLMVPKIYVRINGKWPLLRHYPKEFKLEVDVVSPDFHQGNEREEPVMKTTRGNLDVNEYDADEKSDKDEACQFVSHVRHITFMSEHCQDFGGKSRVAFMNVMQGVAMELPSTQSGTNFDTTSSPAILGDGSDSNFGTWTPQTSCMADPTCIFCPSWNITCETDVLESTYSSDFISNAFPQVTLSQMDKMNTEELTMRRHARMV